MNVHKLYYGPIDGGGLTLKTSEGVRSIVNDDVIQERYSLHARHKPTLDSQIHQTANGPVLSLTRVEQCQASDGRLTQMNHTVFVKLSEVIAELIPLLDFDLEHMEPTAVKIRGEGVGSQP